MRSARGATGNATLLDLLDRLLDRGVVLAGDLTISVADVDLVSLRLGVLLAAVEHLAGPPGSPLGATAAADQGGLPIGCPAPRAIA